MQGFSQAFANMLSQKYLGFASFRKYDITAYTAFASFRTILQVWSRSVSQAFAIFSFAFLQGFARFRKLTCARTATLSALKSTPSISWFSDSHQPLAVLCISPFTSTMVQVRCWMTCIIFWFSPARPGRACTQRPKLCIYALVGCYNS